MCKHIQDSSRNTKCARPFKHWLHLMRKGRVKTTIVNPSDQEVILQAGTQFGHFFQKTGETIPTQGFLSAIQMMKGEKSWKNQQSSTGLTSNKTNRRWSEEQITKLFRLNDSPWLKDPRIRANVVSLLQEYEDIISSDDQYGCTQLVEHEINLQAGTAPIRTKVRPINPTCWRRTSRNN